MSHLQACIMVKCMRTIDNCNQVRKRMMYVGPYTWDKRMMHIRPYTWDKRMMHIGPYTRDKRMTYTWYECMQGDSKPNQLVVYTHICMHVYTYTRGESPYLTHSGSTLVDRLYTVNCMHTHLSPALARMTGSFFITPLVGPSPPRVLKAAFAGGCPLLSITTVGWKCVAVVSVYSCSHIHHRNGGDNRLTSE